MEDRIQINGVWYVRQDSIEQHNTKVEFNKEEVTHTRSCVYETDKYCWEASILVDEHNIPMCKTFGTKVTYLLSIKFTTKFTDPLSCVVEYWDSLAWFEGMLENNPESLKDIGGVMDEEGIKIFQKFLEHLKNDLGWF